MEAKLTKPTPFIYAQIIQMFGKLAAKEELSILRQMSGEYNNILKPVYFDQCNKNLTLDPDLTKFNCLGMDHCSVPFTQAIAFAHTCREIKLDYLGCSESDSDSEDDVDDSADDNIDLNHLESSEPDTEELDYADRSDDVDNSGDADRSDDVDNAGDAEDDGGMVFDDGGMVFDDADNSDDSVDAADFDSAVDETMPGSQIAQFLENVAPYIKKMSFYLENVYTWGASTYYHIYLSEAYLKLLSGFVNLDELVLTGTDKLFNFASKYSETFDVLPKKTQIVLNIYNSEVFKKYEKLFLATSYYNPTRVSIFLRSNRRACCHVDYPGHTLFIESEAALQLLSSQTTEWFRQTKHKFLPLVLIRINDSFKDQGKFMENMDDFLSACGCIELWYSQRDKTVKWILPSGISNWKAEMSYLHLVAYAHPITFLQEFPKLKQLYLDNCDLDVGLFSANPAKSVNENLKDIFGGLDNLTVEFMLVGMPEDDDDEDFGENEDLADHLKLIASQYYKLKPKGECEEPTELGKFIVTLVKVVEYTFF